MLAAIDESWVAVGSGPGRSERSTSMDDVTTVLRFLPVFEGPSFLHGVERGGTPDSSGVIQWPCFEYAPEVLELERTLYDLGWIIRIDWPVWQDDGSALVRGDRIDSADLETLERLPTVIVRKEPAPGADRAPRPVAR
jgi:Family of unknown function (DUF6508)